MYIGVSIKLYLVEVTFLLIFFSKKTAELDKEKNYLTGCHPHGVFAIGAFGVFGCDALEWDKLFPGISCRVCTLVVKRYDISIIAHHIS